MADEITVSVNTNINVAGQSAQGNGSFQADLSATNYFAQSVTIGSSSAAVMELGSLSDPTVLFVKNLDTTNYITIDSVGTLDNFPQRLEAGQSIALLPVTGTIYAKANAAPCQAWVVAG